MTGASGGQEAAHGSWDDLPGAPRRGDIHITADGLHAILHGDPYEPAVGGHLHGTGRPGTSEFPPGWDDATIGRAVLAVARDPEDVAPAPNGAAGLWWFQGWHGGVNICGLVEADGQIRDAYPATYPHRGQHPGVSYNPDPANPRRWDGITSHGPDE